MKMKEFGPQGDAFLPPPLDPPMSLHASCTDKRTGPI